MYLEVNRYDEQLENEVMTGYLYPQNKKSKTKNPPTSSYSPEKIAT